jgi:hypothetical protein
MMSTSCSSLHTYPGWMSPSSTTYLIKWYLVRICLLRSWNTLFFIRANADLLLTFNSIPSTVVLLKSPSSQPSHTPWHAATVATMYSASQVERATTFFFWDCQLIRFLPWKKATPVVLLLVSMSLSISLSQYPTSFHYVSLLYWQPKCNVHETYMIILLIVAICSCIGFSMNLLTYPTE